MGQLKVKLPDGTWQLICCGPGCGSGSSGTNSPEVSCGTTDPGLYNPATLTGYNLWYDTSTTPPVLKINCAGAWSPIVGGGTQEVSCGATDPGVTSGSTIWYDTSTTPGTLNILCGGAWVPVQAVSEVSCGATDPGVASGKTIWYDTTATPGTLKILCSGAWTPVVAAPEVACAAVDPGVASGKTVWYDTSTNPAVLKILCAGAWVPIVTPQEICIQTAAPPTAGGTCTEWYNPTTGLINMLVGGVWTPVKAPPEVFCGTTDPTTTAGYNVWFNTGVAPPVLSINCNGVWTPLPTAATPAPEVFCGAADPGVASGKTVWYDTSTVPSTLRILCAGAWVPFQAAPEVFCGAADPGVASGKTIWYNSTTQTMNVLCGGAWTPINENCCAATAPSTTGPCTNWYDTTNKRFNVLCGGQWIPVEEVNRVAAAPPAGSNPNLYDVWIDTTVPATPVWYTWNGTAWVAIPGKDNIIAAPTPATNIGRDIWMDTLAPYTGVFANVGGVWKPSSQTMHFATDAQANAWYAAVPGGPQDGMLRTIDNTTRGAATGFPSLQRYDAGLGRWLIIKAEAAVYGLGPVVNIAANAWVQLPITAAPTYYGSAGASIFSVGPGNTFQAEITGYYLYQLASRILNPGSLARSSFHQSGTNVTGSFTEAGVGGVAGVDLGTGWSSWIARGNVFNAGTFLGPIVFSNVAATATCYGHVTFMFET